LAFILEASFLTVKEIQTFTVRLHECGVAGAAAVAGTSEGLRAVICATA
jgi:hypothetical protein